MQNHHLLLLLFLFLTSFCVAPLKGLNATAAKADVGVILDFDSVVGKICRTCISMAIEDFYSNRSYTTMIEPHFVDSRDDVVAAASAAIHLLKNNEVMAILGPQHSIQADFVIEIGDKVKVPIISPATSPSLSPQESPYFIRSAWSTSSQVGAIAAIVKKYGWREVVFVYEDNNYGSGLVPFLNEELLNNSASISHQIVVSSTARDDQISQELIRLKKMRMRVFIIHMLPSLASRFFPLAKEAGMMGEGYAWIVADVLTSLLDSMDSKTVMSMQGVVGVKAYIQESDEVVDFTKRWSKRFHRENPGMYRTDLNVFGLWAYDSVTALAEAIERVGVTVISSSPKFNRLVDVENLTDLDAIGTLNAGPSLLRLMKNHTSKGLSGDFIITNGQLQPSAFEIVNVNGKHDIRVGFWTKQCGIVRPDDDRVGCSSKTEDLDPIVWPGKTLEVPGRKLRVGVPFKEGFPEFVTVDETNAAPSGFSIAVFERVMNAMSLQFDYQLYEGDYDELVYKIFEGEYDAVAGDITITANRSTYADFAIPYSESGVAIVVPVKQNERKNAWIFMKPLTTSLWLTIAAFFIFTGFVVWVLEHRVNKAFRGPKKEQVGMMFWFSFSTLVFAHREKVRSNLTRFVVIVWVFVVLVVTSSYTANLTSMLTVPQLQPEISDINDLIKNQEYIGYQNGSFVKGFLLNMPSKNINCSLLRNLTTLEEFDQALSKGSRNGGVAAIVDELPYIRLFLSKYGNKYTMIGPIYPTSGLGFAFRKGSPLVADVSHKIMELKESEEMVKITKYWLEKGGNSEGAVSSSRSLHVDSFMGLFLIAGVSSSIALVIFFAKFLYEHRCILSSTATPKQKLYGLARVFTQEKVESLSSKAKDKEPPSPDHDHDDDDDGGGVSAISIPSDHEEENSSREEWFTSVEITPIQPSMPQQEEAS